MTERTNPFERGEVRGHEFSMPPSLDPTMYDSIGEIQNLRGETRTFIIARCLENTTVPRPIAEWLHNRSFTDNRVMTLTADDRYRFGDIDAICESFLWDHEGRRLYSVIDKEPVPINGVPIRALAAASWAHPLEGGKTGAPILKACEAYNQRQEDPSMWIDPARHATLASRIYAEYRGQGLHTSLLCATLEDYYAAWPECEGIIVRISVSDVNALGAFTSNGHHTDSQAIFKPIHMEDGVAFLRHSRPQPKEDDEPTLNAQQ